MAQRNPLGRFIAARRSSKCAIIGSHSITPSDSFIPPASERHNTASQHQVT